MAIRYKTEQILSQSVHRGGYKKHEIVENIVSNFCNVWGINNWRDINNPSLSKKMFRPKLSLIILLSDFLSCSLDDVNKYFFIRGERWLFTTAKTQFEIICKEDKKYAYIHNECVKAIKEVSKKRNDCFVIKESKINK